MVEIGAYDEQKMFEDSHRWSNNNETLTELKNALLEISESGILDEELNDLFSKAMDHYNSANREEKWVFTSDEPIAAFFQAIEEKKTKSTKSTPERKI